MNGLIGFLTLMVLLFAGLGQTRSIPTSIAYAVAGGLAAIAMVLAIVRYRARSSGSD
jgi:multidrug transporter EmrE-like cation transporter